YLVEPVHALDGEVVDPPGAQGGPRVAERMSGIVMGAPSPPKCAARTAMMIATYATTVMTAQRSIRLPTPHRKVMTNTTMKMPAKMTAKVAILSIFARPARTGLSQLSVNQPLPCQGAVAPFHSGLG